MFFINNYREELTMRKKIVSVFFCVILIFVFFVNINSLAFQPENIIVKNFPIESCQFNSNDIVDDIGWFTSIALDDDNYPHISYYDYTNGDLKYAYWTGSDWDIQAIDTIGNVGRYTSIALNDEGHPHISYYDYTNGDLKYAYWTGSIWSIKKVDGIGKVGLYTSITLDNDGLPHISYCDYTNRALKYAHWNGNSWYKKTVDNSGTICIFEYFGDTTSIAIDSKKYVHISYCDSTNFDLKHAYEYDSTWGIEVVDSFGDVGQYSSLVLDNEDNTHICYGDLTDENFDLKYAVKSNGSWDVEYVDTYGDIRKWISVKLDSQSLPHVSYYDYYEGSLKYTYNDGNDWIYDTVEYEGSTGCFNSLYLDSSDKPCISYYDWGSKAIKYASKAKNDWNIQTLEIDTNTDFLDQEQKFCCGWAYLIDDNKPLAQAFKPSYKALTRVELMAVKRFNPGGMKVSIREDLNGSDLASINLSADEIAEDLSWKIFDFPDIVVTPGNTYYIVCTSFKVSGYDAFYCYFGDYDPYPEGEAWIKTTKWKKLTVSSFPDIDLGFKTFGLDTQPPNIPTIDGPSGGKIRTQLTYVFQSTDPDGDEVSYCIDWGDGDVDYTSFYSSGDEVSVPHTWNKVDTFLIKVKTIDIHGAESDWETHEVSIARSRMLFRQDINGFFKHIFENHLLIRFLQIFSNHF
jgi:hypothetical protein